MTKDDILKEFHDINFFYNDCCKYDTLSQMLDELIEESSSGNPTEWIPCEKQLPKAGEYVGDVSKYYLVQNEYGDMLVARYTHSRYWEQIYQHKPYADKIVAWMPLPVPYESESESKRYMELAKSYVQGLRAGLKESEG